MRTRHLLTDVAALLARTGVGVVFVFHGWQKIQVGVTSTAQDLHEAGVPAATAAAVYSTFVELLGGVALIVGLGLPLAGALLFLDMAGALVFVNGQNGLFVGDGPTDLFHQGFELVLVLGLFSLLFAVGGGGDLTLDRRLISRRAGRREEESYREIENGPVYADLQPEADEPAPMTAPATVPAPATEPVPEPVPATEPEPAPAKPAPTKRPAKPRLASDLLKDDSPPRDVRVAGRATRRPKEAEASE
ncbi:MAG: DoxX family membrane protein [Streptosporangiaceae bacterium]